MTVRKLVVPALLLSAVAAQLFFVLWHVWLLYRAAQWPALAAGPERNAISLFQGYHAIFAVVAAFFAFALLFCRRDLTGTRLGRALVVAIAIFTVAHGTTEFAPSSRAFDGLNDARAVPVLKKRFGHGVFPSDGRTLYELAVQHGYRRALEIGPAQGYSSVWIGLAMKENGGTLTTIEIDPENARAAAANLRQAGLGDVVTVRRNDALAEIPALPGEFDYVFIDAGVPLNKEVLDLLGGRIAPGGAIVCHNADTFRSMQPDFLQAITTGAGLRTAIIPTVSGGMSVTHWLGSAAVQQDAAAAGHVRPGYGVSGSGR